MNVNHFKVVTQIFISIVLISFLVACSQDNAEVKSDSIVKSNQTETRLNNKIEVDLSEEQMTNASKSSVPAHDFPLESIKMPDGFKIDIYSLSVKNARQMALGAKGTLFVGTRKEGLIYALQDKDGDNYAETKFVIAEGLRMPSGLVFHNGDLYVGAVSKILKFSDIENNLENPPEAIVVSDNFPDDGHHGWKYLGLGPDNKLYIPVGAPCNVCDEAGYAEIRTMNLDGSDIQTYAKGVRNSVGVAWHPLSKELWFTDNGRDWLGDDSPDCELNHAPEAGLHFGFPYCHQGDTIDPEFGEGKSCSDYVAPEINLGPHVAPLGLDFYTGTVFPQSYQNNAFIAEHGSWNRAEKIGYRIKRIEFDAEHKASKQEVFAEGWLSDDKSEVWGRPNDVLNMPDGSMLISDDFAGVIYRVTYLK